MASIKKRDNGQWRARYRDEAGREHARHFARKTDAQRWLDEVTTSVVTGNYIDPRNAGTLLSTYAAEWEKIQVGRSSTLTVIDNAIRLHINPLLGDKRIASIRQSDIQGFVKSLEGKELAAGTVRNIYETLGRIFASAVDDRVIASSPCRRIRLPKGVQGEVEPLTLAQVRALEVAMGKLGAAVITLAGSGLRIGELLGLDVSDVDFFRGTIRVERQRSQSGEVTPPKSKSSARTVPVGRTVIDALAAFLNAGKRHTGPLFLDALGGPLTYRQWKPLWKRATVAANVNATAHSLRHFYASALIGGGASVKQVQTVLGHASPVVTLKVYAHLWPGDDDRTRSIIDAILGASADQVRTEGAT